MVKWISTFCLLLLMFISSSCDVLPSSTPTEELYLVPKPDSRMADREELRTIKKWEGTQSQDIKFNTTKAPWVLNSGFTRTSQLSSVFELVIGQSTEFPGVEIMQDTATLSNGGVIALIEDSGIFTIRVKASGVKWWVAIGIE